MFPHRTALAALTLLAWAAAAAGQDVVSGPDRGKAVPVINVFDVTGPHKDKKLDYATERKGKVTVYVLIQAEKWDRPMARFLKVLDKAVSQEKDALVVAVWLTDDNDKTKNYLPLAQQSLQLQGTALTFFQDGKAGPKGWNANDDAHLTAVVAGPNGVAATFGYRSLNETDVPGVVKELKKVTEKK